MTTDGGYSRAHEQLDEAVRDLERRSGDGEGTKLLREILYNVQMLHLKLSEPPGATMTENQGPGTGEGEKVSQEGAEEARKRESAHLWEWATGQRADPPPSLSALEFVVGADFQACFGPVPVKGEKPCTPPVPPATAPAAETTEAQDSRHQESPDETAYRNSALLLRLAAMKFVNPRGRFEDLRPEIDEILRRKYPATEELLSCTPPAPPDTATPAGETSSGGERCGNATAGAASGGCCEAMAWAVGSRVSLRIPDLAISSPLPSSFVFCPWCSAHLQPPAETSPPPEHS